MLKGRILTQSTNILQIEVNFNKLNIYKTNIVEIKNIPDEYINIHLKDGSNIHGKVITQDTYYLKILSDESGEITIPRTNISSMDWQRPGTSGTNMLFQTNTAEKKKMDQEIEKPALSEKEKVELPDKVKLTRPSTYNWSAGWRSALLPSWGQFYKGCNTKAWIILSAQVLTLGSSLGSYFYHEHLVEEYRKDPTTEKHDYLMNWYYINRVSVVLASVCYGFNIVDALLFGPGFFSYEKEQKEDKTSFIKQRIYRVSLIQHQF